MFVRILKVSALVGAFTALVGASAYVTLTVLIRSEETVVVPDLVHKEAIDVLGLLTELGLNTKIKESVYSPTVPKNHVMFQEPAGGAKIKKGRDVRIVVSKGPRTGVPPKTAGLTIRQARILLEENGFGTGVTSFAWHDAVEKDRVIVQSPSPGRKTARGTPINLLVSLGRRPATYMMPDLSGALLDDAVGRIEASDLSLGEITTLYRRDMRLHTVVLQKPLSGHPITEGQYIQLAYNQRPGSSPKSPLPHMKGIHLYRYRLENGFLKRYIRAQVDIFDTSFLLYDELFKPGEEVWIMLPMGHKAAFNLYEDDELVAWETFDPWEDLTEIQ